MSFKNKIFNTGSILTLTLALFSFFQNCSNGFKLEPASIESTNSQKSDNIFSLSCVSNSVMGAETACPLTQFSFDLSSAELDLIKEDEERYKNKSYLLLAPLDPGSNESDNNYGREMIQQLGTRGEDFLLTSGVVIYGFNEEYSRMEKKLLKAFSEAEENDLPLFVHVDLEWFTQNRPDLWNWFDPALPGFDPENKYNVEWSSWDQPIKNFWFNWGGAASLTPKVCYGSPKIRSEGKKVALLVANLLNKWRLSLAKNKKSYLFAGVSAGWETGMPNLKTADWLKQDKDNLGYCSLHHKGFSDLNPPLNHELEVQKIVKEYIDFESELFLNQKLSISKIFTHVAGFEGVTGAPFSQRSPVHFAKNLSSTPGLSLYLDSHGNMLYKDSDVLNLVQNKPWAIVEAPTSEFFSKYIHDENLKLLGFYSWGHDIKMNAPSGDWRNNQKFIKSILAFKRKTVDPIVVPTVAPTVVPTVVPPIPDHPTMNYPVFNIYRKYQSTFGHLFTFFINEGIELGFKDEGIGFKTFSDTVTDPKAIYIFRCRIKDAPWHFISRDSRCEGHVQEGHLGKVYIDKVSDLVPLYRIFNPTTKDHIMTVSEFEKSNAAIQHGYTQYEGILGYVKP